MPFACRCAAVVVEDATDEHTHAFLVPDEGHGAMVGPHDRPYEEGPLSPRPRPGIPFVPRVGVATATDPRGFGRPRPTGSTLRSRSTSG